MSADINVNANFRKHFCSKAFDKKDDPKLLDVEECRIKTRDVVKNFFSSESSQQQEPVQSKFDKMWQLRQDNWGKLDDTQKKICDQNLRWLSPHQFEKKMEEQNTLQEKRKVFLDSYDITIPGCSDIDIAHLKTQLVAYGKAGIDSEGKIVKAKDLDSPDRKELVVEILCTLEPEFPLFAKLPGTGEWKLENGENTLMWNTHKLYNRRILPNVENKFFFHSDVVFSIECLEK